MVWLAPAAYAVAPTITSVGTFTGSTVGGDSVAITGSNYSNITAVKFGGIAASFTVNSTTSITATSPAAVSAGVVDITITNNLGETGTLYGGFVYTDASHAINRWLGNSTSWTTTTNWSRGAAPVSSDIIYINGGTSQPTLTMSTPLTYYAMSMGPSTTSTLTINGGSLTNVLSFSSDTVVGKTGRVTVTANTTTQANSIVWNVTGKLAIASGGVIDVTNTGYSSGNGPGGSATLGCSHGANGINGKPAYGSIKQPTDMGSGCGGGSGGGAVKISATSLVMDGTISARSNSLGSGGSIWLNITNQIQGISSGSVTVANDSSSGSGGRIAVYAASSTYAGKYYARSSTGGAGTIYTNIGSQANGVLTVDNQGAQAPQSTPEMSSGAVTYDDFHVDQGGMYEIPTTSTLTLTSLPASSSSSFPGNIVVKGGFNVPNNTTLTNYRLILADATYSDQNPVVGSASTIELRNSDPNTVWNIQTLVINSGGTLTHTANTTTDTYVTNVNATTSITVNTGGSIDASKKGYSVGNGPGKGTTGIGAGHGGYGYGANATYGNPYGSITQPFESGSGGANSGTGGGRVKITTPSFTNNGTVLANGSGSGFSGSAAGAGGSIWIDATTISGTGSMSATGGNDRGASGGRIALYYDTNTMSGAVSMYSADTSFRGGAGTYYQKVHSHSYGTLTIQAQAGNGKYAVTPLMDTISHYESLNVGNGANLQIDATQTLTVDGVQASASSTSPGYIQINGQLNVPNATSLVNYYVSDNGTYSDQNPIIGSGTTYEQQKTNSTTSWNLSTLTIASGGLVTHPANSTAETYALNVVTTGDITINSGGSINVLGKGYSCSNGPGAGGPAIAGYGNGGSYGGAGGRTNTTYPTVLYGSSTQPTNSGSGGTCYSGTTGGGSGGGVAMLKSTSGNIIVNGSINANGGVGNAIPYGSGGSGGSIWLQATTVTGTGTLTANGANPYSNSGAAGGGGRIAFTYSNNLQVLSASPNKGVISGGDAVTLTGNGFSPTTLIYFGANSATVTYNSSTSLTATAPAAASNGFVDIIAKNKYFNGMVSVAGGVATTYPGTAGSIDPQGTYQVATLTNGYEYGALTPQITSVTPNYGVPAGGNTVTINGQNFMTGPTVEFGGIAATNVTFVSSTQLTVTAPAHAAGAVDVKVTNTNAETVTATGAYTYSDIPTISSVTPASGTTAGGDSVVISGTHFTPGMTVKFGGTNATNISVVNDTTITATTPAGTRGAVDVVVANTFTQSGTLTNGFQYLSPAPQVTSFTPTQGTMAGGTTVTFSGSNFDNTMKAYFNGQAGVTTGSSSSSLTVKTPAGSIGNATITISGPDTETLNVASPYTYTPAAYNFTTLPASLHQTEAGLITVQARDTNNQAVIVTQDTVIALSSSSGTSQFSLSSNTGWGITSVTIPAGSDHADFYLKDTVKGTATITATGPDNVTTNGSVLITSRYQFLVTGVSDPINSGTPSSVTVQTTDWMGNPLNDYTGTIHFTSSDAFAQLPGDLQFTADMQGNHTFVNGVTLITNGEQTVTATDTADSAITGIQSNITVENGYSGPAAKLAVITDQQVVETNKSTSAITVQIQDSNGNPAPAPVPTQIYITTTSSTGSFRADEANAWTAGQTFTITIPANSTAASFYYKDTTQGNMSLSIRDQASNVDSALTDTSQTVVVGAGIPYRLAIDTQSSQLANKWNPITITLRDDQDRQLTIGQNPPTIYLTSSNSSLQFASDNAGTGATNVYSRALITGTNKLVVFVRSSSAQQLTIHVSDSQPANGSTGLLDDDKLVNYVTQQATHLSLSMNASAAADEITPVTITALNDNGDVAPVSGNKTITLSSTGTGIFSLASTPWSTINSLVIPDGSSTATVYYRNQTAGNATVQADSTLGQANRSITITPGTYAALAITGTQNVQVDTPTQYALSLRDVFGNQTTSQTDTQVYLYTTSGSGQFESSPNGPTVSSMTIPAGTSTVAVYYLDTTLGQNSTLTASDQTPIDNPDSGITNGSLAITTVGQTVDKFVVTTPQRTVIAGQVSSVITVQAQTASGQPARVGSNTTLTLSSNSSGQPIFYSDAGGTNQITSITIPTGDSQVSFYYADTKAGTFTLDALHSSGLYATQSITVMAGSVTDNGKLLITTPPQTKESGAPSDAIRIATADKFGNEAPAAANTLVTLGSDCAGSYSLSPSSWNDVTGITIATGSSSATVYFRSDVTCILQVSANGFASAQQNYTIQNGPYRLSVSGPSNLELNEVGTYTVSFLDINGNVVPSTLDRTIYLSGSGLQPDSSSFVMLAGQSSHTITARAIAVQTASLDVRDESNIATPDTGLVNASTSTTVSEGVPTQLGITSLTGSPSTDASTHLSVSLLNASGGKVNAPANTTIDLSTTASSGTFHATSGINSPTITNVVLPLGQSSVDVYYYQTSAGQALLTAQNASYASGQLDITTASGAIVAYQLSASKNTIERGETVTYTATALDANGNVTTWHYGDFFYIDYSGGTITSGQFDPNTHKLSVNTTTSAINFGLTATTTGSHTTAISDVYPLQQPDTGITDASHSLTVIAGAPAKLAFTNPNRTVERGGVSDVINVELQNAHSVSTTSLTPTNITMQTGSPTGKFATSSGGPWTDTTFTLPSGSSTLSLFYTDVSQPTSWQLTAASSGLTNATQGISVVGGLPVSMYFIGAPTALVSYHDSPGFQVELRNQYGYPTNKQNNDQLVLSTDAPNGEFADSQHNWQTNVVTWNATTQTSPSPTIYYRSYTLGNNTIKATLPGMTAAQQSVNISPQNLSYFVVTNVSDPIQIGVPSSIVVIAKDSAGYTVPSYAGTIDFAASDPATTVPGPYTFDPPTDRGSHTFVNGIRFASSGEKSITVTDHVLGISGVQEAITVLGATAPTPSTGTKTPVGPAPTGTTTPSPTPNTGSTGSETPTGSTSTDRTQNNSGLSQLFRPLGTSLSAAGQIVGQIINSKSAPYTAPTVVFGVFFGYTLLLAAAGYKEAQSAHVLAAIIKREKKTAHEKSEFINLLSHHLRTPMAIISGTIDLIMFKQKDRDVSDLKTMSNRVQADVDSVLETAAKDVADIQPDKASTDENVYVTPRFWLPIVIALVATIAINLVINTQTAVRIHAGAYLYQAALVVVAMIALYLALRSNMLRKREVVEMHRELSMRTELDTAKNDALDKLAHTIDGDLTTFEQVLQNESGEPLAGKAQIEQAEHQLAEISQTAKIISDINTAATSVPVIPASQYLNNFLSRLSPEASVRIKQTVTTDDKVTMVGYPGLLTHVLDSLIDNALKYSPDGSPVLFKTHVTHDQLMITITNTGDKLPDDILRLDQPFIRGEETATETVQGLGLSLYADKLMLTSMGGSISLKNDNDKVTAIVTLQRR